MVIALGILIVNVQEHGSLCPETVKLAIERSLKMGISKTQFYVVKNKYVNGKAIKTSRKTKNRI
jgi:hypothetical protein